MTKGSKNMASYYSKKSVPVAQFTPGLIQDAPSDSESKL